MASNYAAKPIKNKCNFTRLQNKKKGILSIQIISQKHIKECIFYGKVDNFFEFDNERDKHSQFAINVELKQWS